VRILSKRVFMDLGAASRNTPADALIEINRGMSDSLGAFPPLFDGRREFPARTC
jgi:hypothetical protein